MNISRKLIRQMNIIADSCDEFLEKHGITDEKNISALPNYKHKLSDFGYTYRGCAVESTGRLNGDFVFQASVTAIKDGKIIMYKFQITQYNKMKSIVPKSM